MNDYVDVSRVEEQGNDTTLNEFLPSVLDDPDVEMTLTDIMANHSRDSKTKKVTKF